MKIGISITDLSEDLKPVKRLQYHPEMHQPKNKSYYLVHVGLNSSQKYQRKTVVDEMDLHG